MDPASSLDKHHDHVNSKEAERRWENDFLIDKTLVYVTCTNRAHHSHGLFAPSKPFNSFLDWNEVRVQKLYMYCSYASSLEQDDVVSMGHGCGP